MIPTTCLVWSPLSLEEQGQEEDPRILRPTPPWVQGGVSSPLLANNRSESPSRQQRACAARGDCRRLTIKGVGLPWGSCSWLPWLLSPNPACSITLAAGTRPKREDCALRELVLRQSSACRCPLAGSLPSLPGVSVQGQTFQEKAWSEKAWACHLTGSAVRQTKAVAATPAALGTSTPGPPLPLL